MDRLSQPHFLEDDRGIFTSSYGPFMLRSAFQPIFSQNAEGHLTIEAFEALIRAQRGGEPVSPHHFFSMVEPADSLAIDTLCRELHIRNMGRLNRRHARLFINFNPGLFTAGASIEAEVAHMLDVTLQAGLRPSRIVCEITEQGGDAATIDQLVGGLRRSMFKIAVDDFGAEDSDIARVDKLQPDVVKFDSAWVRRFTETSPGRSLLELMVSQFIDRGITVLFEGLEEDDQIDFCREVGVQLMQGFALARPELAPTTFHERFPEQGDRAEPPVMSLPRRLVAPQLTDNPLLPDPQRGAVAARRRSVPFGRRSR
ncbi:EAL domain-containing protein (putative c-di-GMP-specific phosphodiesterase class I) [Hoeflea marina]|uniref:EAL domain-containing protein (Putative c-di-GMP-specific phosphodiesterase class I) n=1 Tax=Hoeflea marina TaxID=274592 RepID=A0A317PDL9_9HYPH|nr:EAL domain-containing protein [Hoeflea marina]PWV97639.1 EAL domain-containing protein (putative c-di-GMP-specific phosphodiesterase class I) [Hoeflea marina]